MLLIYLLNMTRDGLSFLSLSLSLSDTHTSTHANKQTHTHAERTITQISFFLSMNNLNPLLIQSLSLSLSLSFSYTHSLFYPRMLLHTHTRTHTNTILVPHEFDDTRSRTFCPMRVLTKDWNLVLRRDVFKMESTAEILQGCSGGGMNKSQFRLKMTLFVSFERKRSLDDVFDLNRED